MKITNKIMLLTIFGIAMAFVESAVVVYLRAIFYPEGFNFPLKAITDHKILIEVYREIATIIMLLSVSYLSGKDLRERFACFMLSFGVWDIFYYVWLKALLNWPASIFDWDILFLIPLPWIAPVIAPVSISILMIIFSIMHLYSSHEVHDIRPKAMSYILLSAGTILILYSFMYDTGATLHQQMPKPYRYELLVIGEVLYTAAFVMSYRKNKAERGSSN